MEMLLGLSKENTDPFNENMWVALASGIKLVYFGDNPLRIRILTKNEIIVI